MKNVATGLIFSSGLLSAIVLCGLASAQDAQGNLVEHREAMKVAMIDGCILSILQPAMEEALRKAKAAGRTDVTEAGLRSKMSDPTLRKVPGEVCRCWLTEYSERYDSAKTIAEIDAIPAELQAKGGADLLANMGQVKACYQQAMPASAPAGSQQTGRPD